MSKSRSFFTSKPCITTAVANPIKNKNKICKKFYKVYSKTYRNHLTTLLRITKDEHYKIHFTENKIIENRTENY